MRLFFFKLLSEFPDNQIQHQQRDCCLHAFRTLPKNDSWPLWASIFIEVVLMVSMQSEGGHEDGPVKILFSCHRSFIGGGEGIYHVA